MAAVTVCSDFGAQEIKSVTASNFSPIYHEVLSLDAVILVFLCWVPSHSPLSPSSRLLPLHLLPLHWHHLHIQGGYFSQESWSNLWFFQPGIFHDVLCMQVKYTANLEPVVCSMSCSNCCYWLAHRFIRRQVRRSGTPVSWRFWFWGRSLGRSGGTLEFLFTFACQILSTWPLSWVETPVLAPSILPRFFKNFDSLGMYKGGKIVAIILTHLLKKNKKNHLFTTAL